MILSYICIIAMLGIRTSFPTNFWSAKTTFVPEAKEEIKESFEDVEEPYHQEKMAILETRVKLKDKTKEQKERAIPGMKLLKKLHKQQHNQSRMEESISRVVKNLSI
jgi:hypothetical protein